MAEAPATPSTTEGLSLNFMKWQLCVLVEGENVMVAVTKKIFEFLNSDSGTETMKEYLHNKNWNRSQMEQLFTKDWTYLLNENLINSKFDITLAFKLLTKPFSDVYHKLSVDCKNNIQELKSLRNKLSHCFAEESLKNIYIVKEVKKLHQLYTSIYKDVGNAIDFDFSESIESTKSNLDQICNASFKENYDAYKERENDFKNSLHHRLISEGQKELRKQYEKLRVANPCTWMLERDFAKSSVSRYYIEKIYTPLKIEDSRDYEIDAQELLVTVKEQHGSSVIPGALLFHGLAGCGKTALCRYILHSWSDKRDFKNIRGIERFDLVFLLEARSLRERNLKQFLKETMLHTYKHIADAKRKAKIDVNIAKNENVDKDVLGKLYDNVESDVIETLIDLDVLFIVDGFDENRKDATVILEEIIKLRGQKHRIFVTTRPEFLIMVDSHLKTGKVSYLIVKICGFDEKRREEFTIKVFDVAQEKAGKHKHECKRFLEYIKGRGRILGEHLKLPLTLALLIYLWIDKVKDSDSRETALSEVTNCTTLYYQLFKLCQKKLKERLQRSGKAVADKVIEELLLFIGEKAWKCLDSNQAEIDKDSRWKIEKMCDELGVDKKQLMSAFLMCEFNENSDSKDEYSYSFLHKTQMEYLAAQYLAHLLVKNSNFENVTDKTDWEGFQQVIIFFIGHVTLLGQASYPNLKSIFRLVEKTKVQEGSYDFWWKFLIEAKEQKIVGEMIAKHHLPGEVWNLAENDKVHMVVPGLELLMSTRAKIRYLIINIDNHVDPYDVENLLKVMQDLKFKLKNRYGKNAGKPIMTEMHFWRHNVSKHDKSSDDLLRTLHPWGYLTNFTGSLGEQERGNEVLNYCFNLKILRVRLNSVGAVVCLASSLDKIYKSIKKLTVTLDFTSETNASLLPTLTTNGDLEVTIPGVCDADKEWVVEVVKNISRRKVSNKGQGCTHLTLEKSELTGTALIYLMKNLTRVVTEKLSLETNCNITDEDMDRISKKEIQTNIPINWI